MATRSVVTLIDDLTGEDAAETVIFAIDGVTYEIDLSEENAERLRGSLSEFVGSARRLSGRKGASAAAASSSRKASGAGNVRHNPEHLRAVRDWAGRNGHQVSDRGRVPQSVLTAFDEAHKSA